MKKIITIVGLVFVLSSFLGCNKTNAKNELDKEKLEKLQMAAEAMAGLFSSSGPTLVFPSEEAKDEFMKVAKESFEVPGFEDYAASFDESNYNYIIKEKTGLAALLENAESSEKSETNYSELTEDLKTVFDELNKLSDEDKKIYLTANYASIKKYIEDAKNLSPWDMISISPEKIISIFDSIPNLEAVNQIINK